MDEASDGSLETAGFAVVIRGGRSRVDAETSFARSWDGSDRTSLDLDWKEKDG